MSLESEDDLALNRKIRQWKYFQAEHIDCENLQQVYRATLFRASTLLEKNLKKKSSLEIKLKPKAEKNIGEDPRENKKSPATGKSAVKTKLPTWAKKLYREIAAVTHPDKLIGKSLDEDECLIFQESFRKSQKCYEEGDATGIFQLALELDVDVTGLDIENFSGRLESEIGGLKNKIEKIYSSFEWAWGIASTHEKKIEVLKAYAQHAGFENVTNSLLQDILDQIKEDFTKGNTYRKVGPPRLRTRPRRLKK
jgi:hypothetical protein